jgi:hypothetical protein
MFLKIMLGLVAFWVVGGCGVASTMISERMLTDLNARLPEDRRFTRNWWYFPKTWDFYSTYWRSGLPRRPLVWQFGLGVTGLVTMIAVWVFLLPR